MDGGRSLSLPLSKRLKTEIKVQNNRRIEKVKIKRVSKLDTLPSPSKSSINKDKYIGPPTVILDNGAYTAKIGISTVESPHIVPNCIMKVKSERKRCFIGNQIDECCDLSGLYYLLPYEKGYLLKFNVQKSVWDYIFTNVCPIEDKQVIMTQPTFNFRSIQEITDEIFFEEYEIKAMFRANATDLAKYEYVNNIVGKNVSCIVVDSGFSFTNIIPYIGGKKYYKGIRRINVGGKVLTNYLKDILSYRQLHVMDETYVINQVKEDTGFVSLNVKEDMKIASSVGNQNTIVKNYVLPDFNNIRRGYIQNSENSEFAEGCQILRLNNERFMVPELLFHPSDIGMGTAGIAETIVKCILRCPPKDQHSLAKNIVLIGGNANFPGYKERVYKDVRSYLPDHWNVNVYKPNNPITFAWEGGKSLIKDPKLKSLLVTKEQYEERGSSYTYERFSDWLQSSINTDQEISKSKTLPSTTNPTVNVNFSRFDLFGKYEPETEEINDCEEDNVESDKTKELNIENCKNADGGSNADSLSKDYGEYDDSQSSTNSHDVCDIQQDDVNSTKVSEKINKHSKSTKIQNVDFELQGDVSYKSYDFEIFENNYI